MEKKRQYQNWKYGFANGQAVQFHHNLTGMASPLAAHR
jgi:hypothetical protein